MLVDSFVYEEYDGIDRSQQPKYKEEKVIKFVRIDRNRTYYRDSDESGVRAEATIYCYQSGTDPFINFKEKSRITFDEESYTLREVRKFSEIYSQDAAAVQLEVI